MGETLPRPGHARQSSGGVDPPHLLRCAIGETGYDIPVIGRVVDISDPQPRDGQSRHRKCETFILI